MKRLKSWWWRLALGCAIVVGGASVVLWDEVADPEWEMAEEVFPDEPVAVVERAAQEAVRETNPLEVQWMLPDDRNERVDHWIAFLTGRNRDRTALWLERKGRYGPMILQELRARDMPEDLIYLAMIESGFSANAYSRAHAVGIWQFIAETGRRYGLEVTGYVDERRDPVRSTTAALSYLSDLHHRFGSWYLASAGYNAGENRVERILRQRVGGARGSESLYWRISRHLPRETQNYVPLILAARAIAADPDAYGFTNLRLQEPLRFETVGVPGGTSLSAVARAAGVEEGDVRSLNPHLVRGMTPPNRRMDVRIPVGTARGFAQSFERIPETERRGLAVHTIRRGETLSHIAVRYGTTVAALREANGRLDPGRLQVGHRIQVPVGTRPASATQTWRYHQVQRGDTLWGIARRYDVSVADLRAWNGLRTSRILPGQRIRVRST